MPLLWIKPVHLHRGVLDVTAFKNYNGDESTNMSIMMALESGTSHPIAKAMVYYKVKIMAIKVKLLNLKVLLMYQVKGYKVHTKAYPYNLGTVVG